MLPTRTPDCTSQPHLHIACRRRLDLAQAVEDLAARRDHDPRRSRGELGDRLLADGPHHVETVGAFLPAGRVARLAERVDGERLAALFDNDVDLREFPGRGLDGQLEGAVLADELAGLLQLDRWPVLTTGPEPGAGRADRPNDEQKEEESEQRAHSPHHSALMGSDPYTQVDATP
jgi:hypothetical protein